jgi:hypothetical protein
MHRGSTAAYGWSDGEEKRGVQVTYLGDGEKSKAGTTPPHPQGHLPRPQELKVLHGGLEVQ